MCLLKPFYEIEPSKWLLKPTKIPRPGSTAWNREKVRQWVLKELIETYRYPKEWTGTRIQLFEEPGGFFGLILTLKTDTPFIFISVSHTGSFKEAENNLRNTMTLSCAAGIGMATDGTISGTNFLRRKFDTQKCEYISDLELYANPSSAPGTEPYIVSKRDRLHPIGRELEPVRERIENIFFELHSHIRDIDGLHADEALDELCKVLYVKLYDEELKKPNEPTILQKWVYGSSEELAAATRMLYLSANEYDIRVFRLKIPEYERSRGVFNSPIRLSSPALFKVIEKLQRYSLIKTGIDVKGRAFQKVLGPAVRAGMGQYFTPEPVIDFMVNVAQPQISELILDPFCGSGHFLSKCLQFVRTKHSKKEDRQYHEFAFGKLHGIEKSDRMVRVAMTDMRLHGDGHSNIRCADSLISFANYPDLEPESFDLILTNPPFGSLLSADSISQLGRFALAEGKKNVPLEILGLERCIQFLRPGGRMGIVLPDSVLTNRNTHYVREWVQKNAKVRAVISLPIETFHPFGANIKTSILFLRKWESGEKRSVDYPVYLVRIDSVGYDAAGRVTKNSDIEKATKKIIDFLKEEGW